MTRVSQDEFIAACHDLDQEAFVAFVAALYRARGRSVEQTGVRRLTTTGRDNESDLLIVAGDEQPATVDADTVVLARAETPRPADSGHVVDLRDLHEQLLYAVDGDAARTIAREHLDIDFERAESDSVQTGSGGIDSGDSTGDQVNQDARSNQVSGETGDSNTGLVQARLRDAQAVLLIALIVALAGVPLLGALDGGEDSRGVTDLPATPGDGTTATPARTPPPDAAGGAGNDSASTIIFEDQLTDPPDEAGTYGPPLVRGLPPGVSATGVTNAKRLARAHRQSLSNASYTFHLARQEFVDGKLTGAYSQTLQVTNGSRYVLSDSLFGRLRTTPRNLGAGQPNGIRIVGVDTTESAPESGNGTLTGIRLRVQDHLTELLTASESDLVAASPQARAEFKLLFEGAYGSGANGVAFVSERGRVRYGRWAYETPEERTFKVVTTVRLTQVGSTKVPPTG